MRTLYSVVFAAGVILAGSCSAGDAAAAPAATDGAPAPAVTTPAPETPGNWEKFKEGVMQAGGAVAAGAKDTAEKTSDAVVRGAEKTGDFFSESYQDAKRYIHEKTKE